MLIDCLLCAGHWRKQRTDLGVNTNEETKVEFRPYGPGKYSGQKEVMPAHLRFTPKHEILAPRSKRLIPETGA